VIVLFYTRLALAPRRFLSMAGLHNPQDNHLLAALSSAARERIYPQLQLVEMSLGKVIFEPGDLLRHVYSLVDCIVSLLYVMEDGGSAEISVVGNEGLIGIALFMGGETTSSRAVVQSAGYAYQLFGHKLKDEFHRNGGMQVLLLRYTQALITQMSQTVVCNRHHKVDQSMNYGWLQKWAVMLPKLASDRANDERHNSPRSS